MNVSNHISIHALRKESDRRGKRRLGLDVISIHALRKESDMGRGGNNLNVVDFNPRSP